MKKIALLLVLVALPAAAQSFSASLSYGRSQTVAQTYATTATVEGQQDYVQFSDATFGALGAHLAWTAVSFGPLALEVTGAYQATASQGLTEMTWGTLQDVPGQFGAGTAPARLRESYAGLGVRLANHLLVDWSVGVEGRAESLRLAAASGTLSTTLTRPWAEASVGYTFPSPILKPFVAVSWSLALSKVSNDGTFDNKLAQALAPRAELALQAGIRF
jgi:hypothetical protein